MDSGAKGGAVAVERKQDFTQTAGHFDAADLSAINLRRCSLPNAGSVELGQLLHCNIQADAPAMCG